VRRRRRRRREAYDITKIRELAAWVVNGSRDMAGISQARSQSCQVLAAAKLPLRPAQTKSLISTENIFVLEQRTTIEIAPMLRETTDQS